MSDNTVISANIHMRESSQVSAKILSSDCYVMNIGEASIFFKDMNDIEKIIKALNALKRSIRAKQKPYFE
jgi:hypothetical protein